MCRCCKRGEKDEKEIVSHHIGAITSKDDHSLLIHSIQLSKGLHQVGLSDASDLVNTSFARSYTHHQVMMIIILIEDSDIHKTLNCVDHRRVLFATSLQVTAEDPLWLPTLVASISQMEGGRNNSYFGVKSSKIKLNANPKC